MQPFPEPVYVGFATEAETAAEIKRVYDENAYIEDPHTAVSAGFKAYAERAGTRPTVIVYPASLTVP